MSPPLIDRFARRIEDVRGVAYAAEVASGLWRGGTPSSEGVAWLKERGIRTVVNLRHFHGDTEGDLVKAAGMHYAWLKLASSSAPTVEQIAAFLTIVTDASLRPVYVHCLHGVDRTGAMMAVYRMEVEGWSNEDAFAEMKHFEAHRLWRDLRNFVRGYVPRARRA